MSRKTDSTTLQSLFPNDWSDQQPATLVDLAKADWDSLDEQAKALRSLLVAAKHEMEREPILTASTAMTLLGKHHLPSLQGKWVVVALDRELHRVYAPAGNGAMRMVRCVGKQFPTIDDLNEKAPLKENGSYLAIFGGTPERLTSEDEFARFDEASRFVKFSDVIFWNEAEESATFWSVKAGVGQCGSQPVEFPEPEQVKKWWNAYELNHEIKHASHA